MHLNLTNIQYIQCRANKILFNCAYQSLPVCPLLSAVPDGARSVGTNIFWCCSRVQ